jgi:hypothetical protein
MFLQEKNVWKNKILSQDCQVLYFLSKICDTFENVLLNADRRWIIRRCAIGLYTCARIYRPGFRKNIVYKFRQCTVYIVCWNFRAAYEG